MTDRSDLHVRKAARLLVLREILAQWPDIPTLFVAEALGVSRRTIERDLHAVAPVGEYAQELRKQIEVHQDPDWVDDSQMQQMFGWTTQYIGNRLPDAKRWLLGKRLWHVPTLQAYVNQRPAHGRRGGGRRRGGSRYTKD